MINWDDYENFSEHEFTCRCGCGQADMTPAFMRRLQILRTKCGFAFSINSGFRCHVHDANEGGKGEHTHGEAVDIGLSGGRAQTVLSQASGCGFNRWGIKQHGPHNKRFIHLGTLIHPDYPSPALWSYKK
ncbi:MAG: D-Ala-D-Ala carboxypeptidase family metallohydrolase [Nitrospinaceae bacterium]